MTSSNAFGHYFLSCPKKARTRTADFCRRTKHERASELNSPVMTHCFETRARGDLHLVENNGAVSVAPEQCRHSKRPPRWPFRSCAAATGDYIADRKNAEHFIASHDSRADRVCFPSASTARDRLSL